MLDYTDLNEDEKRTLRDYLGVERIFPNYLEDHNILIMKTEELFDYIFLYDLKRIKDAKKYIKEIVEMEIKTEDINKKIAQKILEQNNKVIKISDKINAYKERW